MIYLDPLGADELGTFPLMRGWSGISAVSGRDAWHSKQSMLTAA